MVCTTSRRIRRIVILSLVLGAATLTGLAQTRDRTSVPDNYKWNLADLYPTDAAWRSEKDAAAERVPALAQFKGKLGSSAAVLADALDTAVGGRQDLSRLYVYASMLADQDTRDAAHQGMQQEMIQLATDFGAAVAFIEPEILRVPTGDGREVRRRRTAAEGVPRSISRTSPAARPTRSASRKRSCWPARASLAGRRRTSTTS